MGADLHPPWRQVAQRLCHAARRAVPPRSAPRPAMDRGGQPEAGADRRLGPHQDLADQAHRGRPLGGVRRPLGGREVADPRRFRSARARGGPAPTGDRAAGPASQAPLARGEGPPLDGGGQLQLPDDALGSADLRRLRGGHLRLLEVRDLDRAPDLVPLGHRQNARDGGDA
eukprot:13406852-Alexandrium_andersonii.AAC.1